MKHLCFISDLSNEDIQSILDQAGEFKANSEGAGELLKGRIIASAFYEPSTRTRLSFEAASHRLGADVIGFSDAASTSSSKGETLEDSMRVLGGYADAIVLRHTVRGAASTAAAVAGVPVINAGDGDGEHPTQTLLDLFTMQEALGTLAGKTVALVGDLRYGRTVHSLAPALQRLGATIVQVPVNGLELPESLGSVETLSLEEAAASDVIYVTRVQKERMQAAPEPICVDAALLKRTKSSAIVMHPLPRVGEIHTDVDALPAAKYFEQARNGVPVRMAVLAHLLGVAP